MDLGRITPVFMGTWENVEYERLSVVSNAEDTIRYISKVSVPVDTELTNTAFWQVFSTNSVDGKSAYELAQDNGFVGTVGEWLDSLGGSVSLLVIDKPTVTITDTTITSSTYSTVDGFNGLHTETSWFAWDSVERTTLIASSPKDSSALTSWSPIGIPPETTVYIECVYHSGNFQSEKADMQVMTTGAMSIETPTLIMDGTPNSISLSPVLLGGNFNVIGGEGTHTQTFVEVIKTSDGSVVYSETLGAVTSVNISETLIPNTEYKFKLKYGTDTLLSNWGELIASTADIYTTSQISVENTDSVTPLDPELTITYEPTGHSEVQVSTTWRVIKTSDSSIVWEVEDDTTNLLTIDVPSGVLEVSTEYRFEGLTKSNSYTSNLSSVVMTTTASSTVSVVPDYATGDRTALINISASDNLWTRALTYIIDGSNTNDIYLNTTSSVTNKILIMLEFDTIVSLSSIKFTTNDTANTSNGIYKFQKSVDGNTWEDIVEKEVFEQTVLSFPRTETKWFRLLGVSGSAKNTYYQHELILGDD